MSSQSSHGTFRNSRKGGAGDTGFRILAGLVGVLVLLALIAIATALLKLRDQVHELHESKAPAPVAGGTPRAEIEALRSEVAALQTELASRSTTATADRQAIKTALAHLLHQHEADSSLVTALLDGVSDEVREEILSDLDQADPAAGHRALRASLAALERELNGGQGGNGSGDDHGESEAPGPAEVVRPNPPEPPVAEEDDHADETYPPQPALEEDPPPDPDSEPPPSPSEQFINYTVVDGDNLSKIARKHSVSMDAIVKANGIENPNLIAAGDVLKIPVGE